MPSRVFVTAPRIRTLLLCVFVLAASPVFGGMDAKAPIDEAPGKNGDWCSWLEDKPGTLYKNKKNPYIQEIGVFGRFQWQYAYVDGSGSQGLGTRDFNYDTEEIRRFRVGARVKFLEWLELAGSVNLSNDLSPLGGPRKIEYFNLYSATLAFDAHKAFDLTSLDSLDFTVGKKKDPTSGERAISSRFIKTVERSSLSRFIAIPSSTGMFLAADKGPWAWDFGVSSGDLSLEFSDFDRDYFYVLHSGYKAKEPCYVDKFRVDLRVVINGDENKNSYFELENFGTFDQIWSASLSTRSKMGRCELLTDIICGDNGEDYSYSEIGVPTRNPEREGTFWGLVIMPSYWLVEDRFETVFRYQYVSASEEEGFRIAGRYARIAGEVLDFTGPNDLSNGRGDRHHSAYLGLNYYLCGDNAKLMAGVEYDDLNSGSQDVYDGFTGWAAFRMYF